MRARKSRMQLRMRQRQRISQNVLIVFSAASITLGSVCSLIYMNFSNISKSIAQKSVQSRMASVRVQEMHNDLSMLKSTIQSHDQADGNSVFYQTSMEINSNKQSQ